MQEKQWLNDLQDIVDTFALATEISCKIIDSQGQLIYRASANDNKLPLFCCNMNEIEGSKVCEQSQLYGGLQAEQLGEPYIYFCAHGLVNWSVPLPLNEHTRFFVIAGPVLLHQIDELLIEQVTIHSQGTLTSKQARELLKDVVLISPTRLRYMTNLLWKLVKPLIKNYMMLEKNRATSEFNTDIAETIHRLKAEFSFSGEEKRMVSYSFEKEKELVVKVKLGDKKGARKLLNEILGSMYFSSDQNFNLIKARAIELMVILSRAAIEVGANLEVIFGLEYRYLENINTVDDINALSNWLIEVLDRFMECTFTLYHVKNRDIIFKAMEYIRSHYNKEISLEQVASYVNLNSAYFSRLFKQETKVSYSDYVNRVRIEASKQLLLESYSLIEISQMCGFNDQSYFSRIFKKFEGLSPGKWQQQLIKN